MMEQLPPPCDVDDSPHPAMMVVSDAQVDAAFATSGAIPSLPCPRLTAVMSALRFTARESACRHLQQQHQLFQRLLPRHLLHQPYQSLKNHQASHQSSLLNLLSLHPSLQRARLLSPQLLRAVAAPPWEEHATIWIDPVQMTPTASARFAMEALIPVCRATLAMLAPALQWKAYALVMLGRPARLTATVPIR